MTMYAQQVKIRVLIIRPDDSYEIRDMEESLPGVQDLERVTTPHGDLWVDEDGKLKGLPVNMMATYLWWKLSPECEGLDVLRGPVFVTGPDDGEGFSLPVSDELIDLYERMEQVRREEED